MSRKRKFTALLACLLVFAATLPALAAAVRGRPQGPYSYRIVASWSFNGQNETGRNRGGLNLSGTKITGQSNDGEHTFNLRLDGRVNRTNRQNFQATGNVITDFGASRGRIVAATRVQKTRAGIWKITANYTGSIRRGPDRGAQLSGRIVGKSI